MTGLRKSVSTNTDSIPYNRLSQALPPLPLSPLQPMGPGLPYKDDAPPPSYAVLGSSPGRRLSASPSAISLKEDQSPSHNEASSLVDSTSTVPPSVPSVESESDNDTDVGSETGSEDDEEEYNDEEYEVEDYEEDEDPRPHHHHGNSLPCYEPMHDYHAAAAAHRRAHEMQMHMQLQGLMRPHVAVGREGTPFIIVIDPPSPAERAFPQHGYGHSVYGYEREGGGNAERDGHLQAGVYRSSQTEGDDPPPSYHDLYWQSGDALAESGAVGLVGDFEWDAETNEWGNDEDEGARACDLSTGWAEAICKWMVCMVMVIMIVILSIGTAVNWGHDDY